MPRAQSTGAAAAAHCETNSRSRQNEARCAYCSLLLCCFCLVLLLQLLLRLAATDCCAATCCLWIAAAALRLTLPSPALLGCRCYSYAVALSSCFLVGLFFFAVPPPLPYLIRHEGFPKSVLEFLVRKRQRNHDDRKAIDGFFAQGMM